ncbi:MAG TPA: hypothetical protein VLQ65_12065 [Saliniramus sp.]|nr:hypothetical protein [Saliniramus sp.]
MGNVFRSPRRAAILAHMPPRLIRPIAQNLLPRLSRIIALCAVVLLGGCLYGQQRDLTELAQGEIWLALPMGSWLGTQDMGEPEALATCLAPSCRNRIAVGGFRLEGEMASRTEAELRDPERLVRALDARQNADTEAGATKFVLQPVAFSTGGIDGFSLSIAKRGESEPLLHAAAVGRRDGKSLRVVFAVGDDADVVGAAVAQLVDEGF